MESNVTQRVKKVLEIKNITPNGLADRLGMYQQTISKQLKEGGSGVSVTTLVGILTLFPDVSAEWLLRGKGEKMKGEVQQTDNTYVRHLESEVEYLREQNMLLLGGIYEKEKVAG